MTKLKFGTDGWRAIMGEDYTSENVARVANAVADWLELKRETADGSPLVVIGHDCRKDGQLYAETAAKVLLSKGCRVLLANGIVTTPMVSLGVVKQQADLGVVITASHNPAAYNGFKLKGPQGGSLEQRLVKEVEALIPDTPVFDQEQMELHQYRAIGRCVSIDLEELYRKHVEANFDLELIKNSGIKVAYNAMHGAGYRIVKEVLPDAVLHHCDLDPDFGGIPPEPIHRNMGEFAELIKEQQVDVGIATDGDADRIGLYDHEGNFVDSHHIILLLLHYLKTVREEEGNVVVTFSTVTKIKSLCQLYHWPYQVERIGFKYISQHMLEGNVLLGGEESGGIAIKGHIPERDGVWMGLTICELMARTGKSIQELIADVYALVGTFAYERIDLHLTPLQKEAILNQCKSHSIKQFGNFAIKSMEILDGYKYHIEEGEWILIRPSGTEPVLRIYCESWSKKRVQALLEACEEALMSSVASSSSVLSSVG